MSLPNSYGYGSNTRVSRARKVDGTISRDGRMVVSGGIWVWRDSGKPVRGDRSYTRRNYTRRYY